MESVVYFFNKLDEIGKDDWVPSNQDILAARVRTHGIVTTKYTIEDRQYEMYDVGGQRNERRKWAHCFEGVTGIIFVASLSDYDQKMFEDETTNRMKDSVYLFRDICANPAFAETPIILFLNKRDLFQKKIRDVRIGGEGCFRDYDGFAERLRGGRRLLPPLLPQAEPRPRPQVVFHHRHVRDGQVGQRPGRRGQHAGHDHPGRRTQPRVPSLFR